MPDERARSIASYSLMIIGWFWTLFGTSAAISYGGVTSVTARRPVFEVLNPPPGAVVRGADFTWNIVGVFIVLLGLLSYRYTREKIARYPTVRKAALAGTSILLFFGLFMLNAGLFSYYISCYTISPTAIGQVCGNILTFPITVFGIVSVLIGTVSFATMTLSTITVVGQRR